MSVNGRQSSVLSDAADANHRTPAPQYPQDGRLGSSGGGSSSTSTAGASAAARISLGSLDQMSSMASMGSIGAGGGPAAAAPAAAAASQPRIRRRNRMITSCLECRRRKLKCDKQHPCLNCTKAKRDCVFLAPALDSASQLKLTEIKEKMGSLERVLEQEVGRNGAWREARRTHGLEDDEAASIPDDEQDLEPTPLSMSDAVYEKGDDEADDDMADLGFALGKMRLTDRIGGYLRPKFKEEMEISLASIPGGEGIRNEVGSPIMQPASERASTFLAPGPTYLPPASTMFFGASGKAHSLIDFLPSSNAADLLIRQYKTAVHPITKILHWHTFEKRYEQFWGDLRVGVEPVGSLQALVFSTMFSGLISFSEEDVLRNFAVTKKELVHHFQQGTEAALGRAQFLRTTKLETMQAFVMYLIPLCRDQLSRAHSALVGTAIRLAQCMGLHRDGVAYGINAVELQVRRMIWYQICMLDIRTCEAHGPQPGIREGDFDTRFPLNVNDEDLNTSPCPTRDAERWTDMTCTLIRMECNEMHRRVWAERPKVEKKQLSLTALVGKIQNFRHQIQQRYFPTMDQDNPLHRAGKLMLIILTTRMHIMVLHRYHSSTSARIPERLRQIVRLTGLESVEAAIAFETDPALAPYRWFRGALQQYHVAFLLLADASANPDIPEAERMWSMIDYVFEPPQHLSRRQKSVLIITELRDRMEVYSSARKLRTPIGMQKRFSETVSKKEAIYISPGRRSTTSPDPVADPNQIDPTGSAHVTAIMGAVGLSDGGSNYSQNMDWRQQQPQQQQRFEPRQMTQSPPTRLNHTPPIPNHPSPGHASGPWQPDYRLSPGVGKPTAILQQVAPTQLSDELMAEIDWAEWDKFFPPSEVSQAQNQPPTNFYPNSSSAPQLRYG